MRQRKNEIKARKVVILCEDPTPAVGAVDDRLNRPLAT
jgi:hypothetical protein